MLKFIYEVAVSRGANSAEKLQVTGYKEVHEEDEQLILSCGKTSNGNGKHGLSTSKHKTHEPLSTVNITYFFYIHKYIARVLIEANRRRRTAGGTIDSR